MKRRNVIKGLTLIPVMGSLVSQNYTLAKSNSDSLFVGQPTSAESNIFRKIGVEPMINCRGTFTIIGGSLERTAVRQAMEDASHNFVQYDELAEAIGKRLAGITRADWGMVSAGCSAGLKHITAACVTGGDPEKLIRIPNLAGLEKTEVIIPRYSRNAYDHAIRNIGVHIVTVETPEELSRAINSKTAMIYLTAGTSSATGQPLSLETIAEIAKPFSIPILIDAAAENLTIPPVHLKRGATVVAYSGGKAICGPQCAGLMLGDKNILRSAWQASSPHHGPGRDNKVGREEMMGMLAAVEDWVVRDHKSDWKKWLSWLEIIVKQLSPINGVLTEIYEPEGLTNKSPVLNIKWDPKKLHITGDEVNGELSVNKPRIALGNKNEVDGMTSINITTGQMQVGEAEIVAKRIYEVLSRKREPKVEEMTPPSATISGSWDVTADFHNSKESYSVILTQKGNWLAGTQKGKLSERQMVGNIEANKVILRSVIPIVGNNVTFIFDGIVTGETMSGDLHMGEYGTVRFTAKRNNLKVTNERVIIPAGPIKTSGWPVWN